MKKNIFLFSIFLVMSFTIIAQSPQGFNYQAVARDNSGVAITNQIIGLKINLRQGGATGTIVYSETHTVTSTNIGLLNLVVGGGTIVAGTINSIDWSAGPYFIEINMDVTGGTNYVLMGAQQLMSVPYALYAANGGTPGPQGVTGVTGDIGLMGVTGSTGSGSAGMTGATGIAGLNGNNGANGNTGSTGSTGTTGLAGSNGSNGNTGATGANATFAVQFNIVNSGTSAFLFDNASDYNSGSNANPTITLYRGFTYKFNVTVSGHPFRISSGTWGSTAYNVGITNNDVQSGVLTFKVPQDAPSVLHYFCTMHSSMAGNISIL